MARNETHLNARPEEGRVTSPQSPAVGTIAWRDLTVPNADDVRDFYGAVVGWQPEPLDMGGYSDFVMKSPASGEAVAGICYARGDNADLPPQWLVYVVVANLESSLQVCIEGGGTTVTGIKGGGGGSRYCVIRDPAGAVPALMESGAG
jgi:predicted enzyme related to lactoylglutathione lyase